MRKTNFKGEKGITLIALVITIIVLLILAGVAISMLSGENGILNRAVDAKTQTENKSEEEQVKLAATEAMMASTNYIVTKDNLEKILNENIGEKDTDYKITDIVDGWKIEVIKTGNHYSVFKDGSSSYMKWYYKEDENNQNRKTIITNGEIELKVGDYINYDSADTTEGTEKTTYTSPTGTYIADEYAKAEENLVQGSGYSTSQTFDGKAYTGKWKVLGVDEKTGEILIVSADTVQTTESKDYYLRGYTGYQYGETELNNICRTYGYGTGASGARSINVDDVNKLTGYNPNNIGVYDVAQTGTGTKYCAGQIYEYGNKVTYKWTDTQNEVSSTATNGKNDSSSYNSYATYGFNWFDGSKWKNSMQNTSSPTTITTLTSTSYYYYPQTLTTTNSPDAKTGIVATSQEYKTIFCNDSGTNVSYWLALTIVRTYTGQARFGIRKVYSEGYIGGFRLFGGEGEIDCSCHSVRPVVSLKSDIKLQYNSINDCFDIQ